MHAGNVFGLPRQKDDAGNEKHPLLFSRYVTAMRLDFVKALHDAWVQMKHREIHELSDEGRQDLLECKRFEALIHQVTNITFGLAGSHSNILPRHRLKHMRREHRSLRNALWRVDIHATAALRKQRERCRHSIPSNTTQELNDDLRDNPRKCETCTKDAVYVVDCTTWSSLTGTGSSCTDSRAKVSLIFL